MGRPFQTSTPRRSPAITGSLSVKMKAKGGKDQNKAGYQSFYNIHKTRLSARYPFLPSNQIEKRVKQLWDNTSAEKRATFSSSLPGTMVAKSPFRGTILKGLLKKAACPGFQDLQQVRKRTEAVFTSPPSVKQVNLHSAPRPGILRSSEKKRTSTPRVSFRLDDDSMPSPIGPCHPAKRSLASGYLQTPPKYGRRDAPTSPHPDLAINSEEKPVGNRSYQHRTSSELQRTGYDVKETGSMQIEPVLTSQRSTHMLSTADMNVVNLSDGDYDRNQNIKNDEKISNKKYDQCLVNASSTSARTPEKEPGLSPSKIAGEDCNSITTKRAEETEIDTPRKRMIFDKDGNCSTPVRQSKRVAAIAAKAKIKSPRIIQTQMVKNDDGKLALSAGNRSSPFMKAKKLAAKIPVIHKLKKTELSYEEKLLYEFQDDDDANSPSCNFTDTKSWPPKGGKIASKSKPDPSSAAVEKHPEEYNLDSQVNKLVFGQDSQSPVPAIVVDFQKVNTTTDKVSRSTLTATGISVKKRGRPKKMEPNTEQLDENRSVDAKQTRKRGRPKKNTFASLSGSQKNRAPTLRQTKLTDGAIKGIGELKANNKEKNMALQNGNMDGGYDVEHVPWMVSAKPSTSSDEDDGDIEKDFHNAVDHDDDSDDVVYQHYQMDSEDSSTRLSVEDSQQEQKRERDMKNSNLDSDEKNKELQSGNMESARAPSSSDEVEEIEDDFQMASEESSPVLSMQESPDLVSNSQMVCEGFEDFCRTNLALTKGKMISQVPRLESPLTMSPASSDSLLSSLSQDTPEDDGLECPNLAFSVNLEINKTSSPGLSALSRKQRMRLENGECSESSLESDSEGPNAIGDEGKHRGSIRNVKMGARTLGVYREPSKDVTNQRDEMHNNRYTLRGKTTNESINVAGVRKSTEGVKMPGDSIRSVVQMRNSQTGATDAGMVVKPGNRSYMRKRKQDEGMDLAHGQVNPKSPEDAPEPYRKRGRRVTKLNKDADSISLGQEYREVDIRRSLRVTPQIKVNGRQNSKDKIRGNDLNEADEVGKDCENGNPRKLEDSVNSQIYVGWGYRSGKPSLKADDVKLLSNNTGDRAATTRKSVLKEMNTDESRRQQAECKLKKIGKKAQPDAFREDQSVKNGRNKKQQREGEDIENNYIECEENQVSSSSDDSASPTGDGILCDMFQPCKQQPRRLHNPKDMEPESPTVPVSSHLFLEENFFL